MSNSPAGAAAVRSAAGHRDRPPAGSGLAAGAPAPAQPGAAPPAGSPRRRRVAPGARCRSATAAAGSTTSAAVAGPVRRVLLQQPGDQRRPAPPGRRRAAMRTGGRLPARRAGSAPRTWSPPSNGGAPVEHLVQHAAERVQVGRGGHRRAGGPAPVPCTGRCRRSRPSWSAAPPSTSSRIRPDAEVQDLHHARPAASITLDGLRSRWTTPARCAASRPRAICAPIAAAHATGSWPSSPRRAASSSVVPVDVLHRQVRPVAVEPAVDGARQVRAGQPSHDPHLAGEPRGVLVRLGERHLLAGAAPPASASPRRCHRSAQVPGAVDLAHVAAGERPEQLEPTCDDLGLRAAHDRLLPALLPTCRRCRATRGPSVA